MYILCTFCKLNREVEKKLVFSLLFVTITYNIDDRRALIVETKLIIVSQPGPAASNIKRVTISYRGFNPHLKRSYLPPSILKYATRRLYLG